MRTCLFVMLSVALSANPLIVHAASVPGQSDVGQLGQLQARVALLKQRLEAAKLETAIAQADAAKTVAEHPKRSAAHHSERPTVISEYGRSVRNMRAVLGYPGGGTVVVRAGSALPYGGRVVLVSPSGVVVTTTHGVRRTLVFASAPPARPDEQTPQIQRLSPGFPQAIGTPQPYETH